MKCGGHHEMPKHTIAARCSRLPGRGVVRVGDGVRRSHFFATPHAEGGDRRGHASGETSARGTGHARLERTLPLPLRQFDLLLALVTRAGEVVLKEELLKLVWPDLIVEDNTLARLVMELRRNLDVGESNRYIDTVSRRGYRFVAELRLITPES